jgi:hypothetical protein
VTNRLTLEGNPGDHNKLFGEIYALLGKHQGIFLGCVGGCYLLSVVLDFRSTVNDVNQSVTQTPQNKYARTRVQLERVYPSCVTTLCIIHPP